ncbi:MAG: hypothetical protein AAGA23_08785 [Pseudomonadota bacterium]
MRPIIITLLSATLMLLTPAVSAVRLSLDNSGQVLLFPLFMTGSGFQTVFEIRNQSSAGKALRFVARDPLNGRPTLSLNVYLEPGDSWSGALFSPDADAAVSSAEAALAPWVDLSCTFPTRASAPDGLALSAAHFTEDLDEIFAPESRLANGFIEVYEMGTLPEELAGDCDAISSRWATGGTWRQDPLADLSAPTGGIEGYAIIVNVDNGSAHQFEAIALADFRTSPLHTAPDMDRQPSLADVDPPESRVLETVVFGNRTLQVERVSTWTEFPVHAVDALLMATAARTDYSVSRDTDAQTFTALTFPTRPYHVDAQAFYLPAGQNRVLAPFAVSLPAAGGENKQETEVKVQAQDREGRVFQLSPFAGRPDCNLAQATITTVFMTNTQPFTSPCPFTRAEFRVPNNAADGEVRYGLSGEIISDEGHVFRGLPIVGFVIQTITNNNVDLGNNRVGLANYGWARALKLERDVSDGP